jgi:hypothetical protein
LLVTVGIGEQEVQIRQHRADAGLGWLMTSLEALPSPLDAMSLGEFEPDVWIPAPHSAARRGTISPVGVWLHLILDGAELDPLHALATL